MNSTIVRTTFFAVGALVGGGIAAAVTTSRQRLLPPDATHPMVEIGPNGKAQISNIASPVLKYGNPGVYGHHDHGMQILRLC